MSDNIEDGGPAFPNPALADESYHARPSDMGMSLRDWFAGQALAALIQAHAEEIVMEASSHGVVGAEWTNPIAHAAYDIADAMLSERLATGGAA